MPLAAAPEEVAAAFAALQLPDEGQAQQWHDALARFCQRWLLPAGSDLQPAPLPGLDEAGPPQGWLPLVSDPEIRRWAEHLRTMWGSLCRQVGHSTGGAHSAVKHLWHHAFSSIGCQLQTTAGSVRCKRQLSTRPPHARACPPHAQAAPDVAAHPERHSLLAPAGRFAPFVVPGARFREMYYWDTLWSLRGLLACHLTELAQVGVWERGFCPARVEGR